MLRDYHRTAGSSTPAPREQAEASAARAWLADTLAGRRSLLLVDTNEQAARLSAQLRAELVRLGRVDEHGVPLGLQGTYAGVGDLVQARRNGWDLAGYEGNRRGPINRETYRVTAVRDDGGLEVAPVARPRPRRASVLGERMVLPAGYVAEHLALGYASTVHAAQGPPSTPATPSSPPRTGAGRALRRAVPRPRRQHRPRRHHRRGRRPRPGLRPTTRCTATRSPCSPGPRRPTTRSPPAPRWRSPPSPPPRPAACAPPAELLADAAQLAATERTASWLDQLADDGAAHRRAAGPDRRRGRRRLADPAPAPRRARRPRPAPASCVDAVAERPLDGARNLTNVLYAPHHRRGPPLRPRRRHLGRLDPARRQPRLAALPRRARRRRRPRAPPSSARSSPTSRPRGRSRRSARCPTTGAERERVGASAPASSPPTASCAATTTRPTPSARRPKPGQVEAYAAYRAAWRALGRPEVDREELELSDGQLRMRVRAYERETGLGAPLRRQRARRHPPGRRPPPPDRRLRHAEADAAKQYEK